MMQVQANGQQPQPRSQAQRVFRLSNGSKMVFRPTRFDTGVWVNDIFYAGWASMDECIEHFKAIWTAISITWEEDLPEYWIYLDGTPINFPLHLDDAVEWFMILMAGFPATQITVHQGATDDASPLLMTARLSEG